MYVRWSSNCQIEMCAMTTRRTICIVALLSLAVPPSSSLKALFVTVGAAGHVTPMFELAKAMKDHQVTFITHRFAQSYVDMEGYASPSFRIVYVNDSSEALADQKTQEQRLLSYVANQSFFDALGEIAPLLGRIVLSLVNETAHVSAVERFDVIVASGMVFAAPYLCEKVRTPCVLQKATMMTGPFDFNLPNSFSSLKPEDLTQFQYRIYNVVFNIRLMVKVLPKTNSCLVQTLSFVASTARTLLGNTDSEQSFLFEPEVSILDQHATVVPSARVSRSLYQAPWQFHRRNDRQRP